MHAMQYEISLPADYDMGIIRERVATRGAAFDQYPGLGLKAYLIRERGKAGSPLNQYAPFYLWTQAAAMGRFLWGGGGFSGIVNSFGRPAVTQWVGAAFALGPAAQSVPRAATRSITALPGDEDPAQLVNREMAALAACARTEGIHSQALAIDPHSWRLVRFTLWHSAPLNSPDVCYDVLHISRPGFQELVDAAREATDSSPSPSRP